MASTSSSSKSKRTQETNRSQPSTEKFYETGNYLSCSHKSFVINRTTKQSQKYSRAIIYGIFKIVGIKTHESDRPWFAALLHVITCLSAVTLLVTHSWYTVYNIRSVDTDLDIIGGTISIMICAIWCSFGYFSNELSYKLLIHPTVERDLRRNSKTIFKINMTLVCLLLMFAFIVINDVSTKDFLTDDKPCKLVHLNHLICKVSFVSRALYSLFFFLWNGLVLTIMISVCRTQTIAMRRFVQELRNDAKMNEALRLANETANHSIADDSLELIWELENDAMTDHSIHDSRRMSYHPILPNSSVLNNNGTYISNSQGHHETNKNEVKANETNVRYDAVDLMDEAAEEYDRVNEAKNHLEKSNQVINYIIDGVLPGRRIEQHPEHFVATNDFETPSKKISTTGSQIQCLSNEDLLRQYWSFNYRFTTISTAFQRWLGTFVSLILLWLIVYLIYWMDHEATVIDIFMFMIPLVIFPLLCSCYAEVNTEGLRIVKCIYPTEQRLILLRFICTNPLNVTVFGVPITYSNLFTTIFAIVIAFASRLIFVRMTSH